MLSWAGEITEPFRKKAKKLSRAVRVLIFAGFSTVAIFASIAAVGARFAYKVSYQGEYIATVKSKDQFKAAVSIVKEKQLLGQNGVKQLAIVPRWVLYYGLIFAVLIFGAYGIGYQQVDMIYAGF